MNGMSSSTLHVGKGLRSCTSRIGMGKTFKLDSFQVTLVDLLRFNDATVSDTATYSTVNQYTKT